MRFIDRSIVVRGLFFLNGTAAWSANLCILAVGLHIIPFAFASPSADVGDAGDHAHGHLHYELAACQPVFLGGISARHWLTSSQWHPFQDTFSGERAGKEREK